jgi:hypothetical protein
MGVYTTLSDINGDDKLYLFLPEIMLGNNHLYLVNSNAVLVCGISMTMKKIEYYQMAKKHCLQIVTAIMQKMVAMKIKRTPL